MINGVNTKEIEEHTHQLFSSILKEQQKYNHLKGAEEGSQHLIESELKKYEKLKGRGFFFDYLSSGRGHGPFSEQVDGSIKYDLIGGIGPNLLGHSHPLMIKATLESATKDIVMCGNLLSYQEPIRLSQTLLETVKNTKLRHFWLAGSGSFANDNALKMIWQKKDPHYRIFAFEKAFAGRSIATQDITHNPEYRTGMPETIKVDHVPYFDSKDPEGSLEKTISALQEAFIDNRKTHAAIILELVQGEAGFIYGTKEYYQGICKWAKERELYVWIDEVQTFGRTRELFAFQMFELGEYVDVVTIGKALQVCGTLFSEELNPKPGLISGTFNGPLVALNAGEKFVHYLKTGNFYGKDGRMEHLETSFLSRLRHLSQTSCRDKIGHVGGVGTMISFEVGDSSKKITSNFIKALYKNGIISFSAGNEPTRVRFLLPSCLTPEHIDEIFRIIEKTTIEEI